MPSIKTLGIVLKIYIMLKRFHLSQEHEGEIYLFLEALLWSLFPIITLLSYDALSPLYSLTLSTFFATFFFAIIVTINKKWVYPSREVFKNILIATITIGVLYYVFMFKGLEYTSAGNAAIFFQMEILFSFLFFNIWRKESLSLEHTIGVVFMLLAGCILLFPEELQFNGGDIIIIIGTAIPPLGNFCIQKAMKEVSSEYIMFIRSLVSLPFLLFFAFLFGETMNMVSFKQSLVFLLINGFLLFGLSKIFWLEAIHRISVTKAISLATIAPFFTLIFSYFFLGDIPTIKQIIALFPMVFGVILLTSKKPLFQKKRRCKNPFT